MSGKINRTHDVQWRTKEQLKKYGIAPSSHSSKSGTSYQAFTYMCWKGRALHLHFHRERKTKTWNSKPGYKLVRESVTGDAVVDAIHQTLGPQMQELGVQIVYADNDSKLHQKQVKAAWKEYGIDLHPAAGKTSWDRAVGGFPVDFPKFQPLDRTIHHKWKNSKHGGLYYLWNLRKPSRKTPDGFINDVIDSWESIPQETFQNAIEGCRQLLKTAYESKGKI